MEAPGEAAEQTRDDPGHGVSGHGARGDAAERVSFRLQPEAKDTELASTKVKLKRAQGECLGIRSR